MKPKKYLGLLRLLFVLGLVSWGLIQGFAQTKPQSKQDKQVSQPSVSAQPAPARAWIKDPNKVMPMRKMTNAERRQAAARNADRRAAAQRKRNGSTNQGVQR